MKRENTLLEHYKAIRANELKREKLREEAINKKILERNSFVNEYNRIKDSRVDRERNHGRLLEEARNNALSTSIKAIYISALEANTLTDDAIMLAESMVDNWIIENGGATKILNNCKNKTYLLARLSQIVEDVAEEDVEEIEKDTDKDTEDDKEGNETNDKKEEKTNNEEEFEDNTSNNKEPDKEDDTTKEDKENHTLNTTFDDEEDTSEENEEEELVIDDADSDDNNNISIDGEEENKGKVFDELEKEEDIKKAIELIRQRVADAEETFIKRNAEDKKQIDELLSKISDNIKTVENMDDEESAESKIAKESAILKRRQISSITENRPLSIFEKMVRKLGSSIVKDHAVREHFLNENGSIDNSSIIESGKVMYAFLETLNTLQLEKIDADHISKVLEEM